MQSGRKFILLLLSVLIFTVGLIGCDGHETDENTLNVCLCAAPESLDPAFCAGTETEPLFRALFENLLRARTTEDGERIVEPAVAREYEITENRDGTLDYVFVLRSSARWSDGTRVRAQDFVCAWRRLVDPATASPNAALLSMVSGYAEARESGDTTRLAVAALSDARLRVTLDAPCAWFLSDVCTAVATMPLRNDVAEETPNWAAIGAMPGNGAFCPDEWEPGRSLALCRNEHYFEAHSADKICFLFAETPEDGMRRYDEEEVDYLIPVPAATEGAQALPLRETVCLLYNHANALFSDRNARRAFDLSLNRNAIAAAIGGGQTPATGLVPHGLVNTPDDPRDFRDAGGALLPIDDEGYDARCAEARGALQSGGLADFPVVTCLYPVEDAVCETAALACAQIWAEHLGVTVQTEGVERGELERRLAEGAYELAALTFGKTSPSDAMAYLAPYAGLDGANAPHYVSEPYNLLMDAIKTSRDLAARAAMLHDAEVLLLGDTALSPLVFGGRCCLCRETVAGVAYDANGCPLFAAASLAAG